MPFRDGEAGTSALPFGGGTFSNGSFLRNTCRYLVGRPFVLLRDSEKYRSRYAASVVLCLASSVLGVLQSQSLLSFCRSSTLVASVAAVAHALQGGRRIRRSSSEADEGQTFARSRARAKQAIFE